MAKRIAGSELNDRNWDQEDEPEEAGVFSKASSDVMQQRVIKKAKRQGSNQPGGANGDKPSVFSGFAGLTKKSDSGSGSLFGSAKPPSGAGSLNFGSVKTPASSGSLFGSAKPPAETGSLFSSVKPSAVDAASPSIGNGEKDKADDPSEAKYLQSLKDLNMSFLKSIKQHMDKGPYLDLTPMFKDYEKHLDSLQSEKSSSEADKVDKDSDNASGEPKVPSFKSTASEPKSSSESNGKSESTSKPFSFGSASSEPAKGFAFGGSSGSSSNNDSGFKFSTSKPTTGGFSFGSSSSSSSNGGEEKKSGFSFGLSGSTGGLGGGSGFSFAGASSSAAQASSQDKEEEEYVPPKAEVKEIKEEDAIYSKRCKLYYQKDGGWADRGVGNLHLKPVAGDKTQLLIRADTNLGNILLNVIISASMPVSRQGKNNVSLVCVPNPPLSSKPEDASDSPVPMLLRVKTGEDADELLKIIEDRKKLLG